ncbi:helix-turn-helix domain-containing protein [Pontibacter sp. BT731]|uniref:helix-turn-helix domain-containing protein n=1 Tax=Pontibacter coccineus TaxID=3063328 RepID=UPI0026E420C9|nr:helix-turn-helix domain-containing protein [Pontibacter sp. BT731]MDO6389082.1 helix-turn-helix domain-containing protein [Pontibacter sp. BT731]
MSRNEILTFDTIAAFERKINHDTQPHDPGLQILPGRMEERHQNVDPKLGIPALRRNFNLIYLLLDGLHDIQLDDKHRWLLPHDLVIVPANVLYASANIKDCKGFCIEFTTAFMEPVLQGALSEQFPFFDLEAEHVISLTANESNLVQRSFENILEVNSGHSRERTQLLRDYIHILLLLIRDCYKARYTVYIKEKATRAVQLTSAYKHLVGEHFRDMHEVQQYASLLNITPKHLSDVVKSTTGKPPHEMIHNRLLQEARLLLSNTEMSMAEIAYMLHFEDQSHFSHFMKRKTGQTPLEIRKSF